MKKKTVIEIDTEIAEKAEILSKNYGGLSSVTTSLLKDFIKKEMKNNPIENPKQSKFDL